MDSNGGGLMGDMADMTAGRLTRGRLVRGAAGGGAALAFGSLLPAAAAGATGLTQGDVDILVAAEIAEALAVTTYSHIIFDAPFFRRLEVDDQGYLKAAR